ncbi:MAG TPA: hypothetical protein VFS95_07310 [Telluria sp.]|jgi:hypothetical protein|nr:hypothetical protein [Telluria sp.]
MKKYLAVFLAVTALSSAVAWAEDKVDYKKCYKLCMKEIDDHDKCDLMCDDKKNSQR